MNTERQKDNKKNYLCRWFLMALFLYGMIILPTSEAKAAGEKAAFGSESYEWEYQAESPIGFYAQSDEQIDSVTFTISYDPEMLSFSRGAEVLQQGLIEMSGDEIGENEYRRIVYFKPLVAGDTEITIEKTVITDKNGMVTELPPVKMTVNIRIPESCRLNVIELNGTALDGFDPEIATYTTEVGADIEQADIQIFPEEITASISDTTLESEDNWIQIITSGANSEKARYRIHVLKEKQDDKTLTSESQQGYSATNSIDDNKKLTQQKDQIIPFAHKKLLLLALGVVILLLLLRMYRKSRKAKHVARERQRKASKQQKENLWQGTSEIKELQKLRVPDEIKQINSKQEWHRPENILINEMQQLTSEDYQNVSDHMDQDEIEINVQHVTMDFKREQDESGSVKELVIRTLKGERTVEKFRALDDVSFTVMKGEVVGIIGTNGSGKSTILKIISGVLKPTKGKITVDRQKIQLLTLGTGFDMELTGRENVYLNGALIGYTKEYIDEKYDDIVKFAELEGFMDEKVKNYSSGMVSRLGFAIATIRDTPEILILDEVLSVGDMFFRRKSERRVRQMIHGGSTVLIVSHSPSVIRQNCTKVIWIEKGHLMAVGDPKKVCAAYEEMQQRMDR